MKKLLPHVIYILLIAFFIVYANIKAKEAAQVAYDLKQCTENVDRLQLEANRFSELANERAAEADRIMNRLQKCKNAKR